MDSCFSLRLLLFLFQSEFNLFYVYVFMWAEMALATEIKHAEDSMKVHNLRSSQNIIPLPCETLNIGNECTLAGESMTRKNDFPRLR